MEITYQDTKDFEPAQLQQLFLSVEWSSGHYPKRLADAMKNYGSVFSAWHEGQLVGLISSMDDGGMTAYIHYLLVNPDYQSLGIGKELVARTKRHYKDYLRVVLIAYDKEKAFYERCGFSAHADKLPMMITSLWT